MRTLKFVPNWSESRGLGTLEAAVVSEVRLVLWGETVPSACETRPSKGKLLRSSVVFQLQVEIAGLRT